MHNVETARQERAESDQTEAFGLRKAAAETGQPGAMPVAVEGDAPGRR
jgi:hypothetical protein